ncbi:uncharacterized protein [Hetaerina americana]|uniref:uncharacterized protein n=1 Tax=Hetaerina americana TaxID=62018 RepID=UPI003A7F1638
MTSPSGLLPLPFLLLLFLQPSAAATLGQPKAFVLAWPLTSSSFPAASADVAEDDYQQPEQQPQPLDAEIFDHRLGAWEFPLWRSTLQGGATVGSKASAADVSQYAAGMDKRALSILSRWGALKEAHLPSRRIDKEFLPVAQTRSQTSSMRPINQPLRWGR